MIVTPIAALLKGEQSKDLLTKHRRIAIIRESLSAPWPRLGLGGRVRGRVPSRSQQTKCRSALRRPKSFSISAAEVARQRAKDMTFEQFKIGVQRTDRWWESI